MARIFRDNNIRAEGKILPLDKFRLFLDRESAELSEDKREYIVKAAEGYLEKPVPFLPLSLYRQFFITGNRANFEARYFERRSMAFNLALAERYEGKGRFLDKLADTLWAILEESSWILPAHSYHSPSYPGTSVPEVYSEERLHGIALFSATTGATLAAIYHLCKDSLDSISPLICERLVYEVKNRIIRSFSQLSFSWSGVYGGRVNNWCPWIVSNVLLVTALLEEDTRVRTHVVRKAMDMLDNFTNVYAEDGGCDEGPSYWSQAGGSLFDALELIYDMSGGQISLFDNPLIRAIGEYEAKMNIHENRFVNFADCSGKVLADGALVTRYGQRCGSDMLVSFGGVMQKLLKPHANPSAPYRTMKNLATPLPKEAPPAAAATKTYLSGLKVMICRESADSGKGMFLAVKGGHNDESHNHNDLGNFIVYYNGRPVLIDVGVGTYTRQTFSADRYKLWFMQSGYHNLPSFGGIDEKEGRRYQSSDERYDEESSSFFCQLKDAYPEAAGVVSFRRTAALTDGKVKVTDTIALDCEKEIDFHFMCAEAPKLIEEGRISLPEGRTLLYDRSLSCEIEEFYSEGLDAKSAWGSENLWRIHLRATAKEITADFIIE